jgi:hypothetical protein
VLDRDISHAQACHISGSVVLIVSSAGDFCLSMLLASRDHLDDISKSLRHTADRQAPECELKRTQRPLFHLDQVGMDDSLEICGYLVPPERRRGRMGSVLPQETNFGKFRDVFCLLSKGGRETSRLWQYLTWTI